MNPDFWLKKWQDGEIGFHQTRYHPALEKFADKFSQGTILVPLCGKSLDMLYLAGLGHSVIGVELSPIACRDFFHENGLVYTEKTTQDFVVFQSADITLWSGDFFKLPASEWSKVSGVYDRAALVALPVEIRQKYAATFSCSTQKLEILLVSFDYASASIQGPPFSVTESEIRSIYQGYQVEKIHAVKENVRGHEVTESLYWMH